MCVWNVKLEDRHCEYCVVEFCPDRLPKQPKAYTSTQTGFEIQPIYHDNKTE